MRFEAIVEREEIRAPFAKVIPQRDPLAADNKITLQPESIATLREQRVEELLFADCCRECNRMAAIPQGAFAVLQVRKNLDRPYPVKFYQEEERTRDNKNTGFSAKVLQEGRELTPLKYNSKLMNSIWGLYNRYSVHNFKKIDANEASFLAWGINPAEARAKGPIITAGH